MLTLSLRILIVYPVAVLLDLLLGDPVKFPHLIVGMGKMISLLEKLMRRLFPKTKGGELAGGALLAAFMVLFFGAAAFFALWGLNFLNEWVSVGLECLLFWQCLSMRTLDKEGRLIRRALDDPDVTVGQKAVGRIVGRDTSYLDKPGVARAAVESIAESTSDGVIAPMLYYFIGGLPLAVIYKAINTMDSMIAYRNERYLYFGRVAARMDDVAGFLPARFTALCLIAASFFTGFDAKNAWRIFKRDRYKHLSPNSAHSESAVAGALHLKLGGSAVYFGELVEKPSYGDGEREIEPDDIRRTTKLMYVAALIFSLIGLAVRGGIFLWA